MTELTGVDFTDMFTCSFYARRSSKCKYTVKPFLLLGSARTKAAHKMLMKLTLLKQFKASRVPELEGPLTGTQILFESTTFISTYTPAFKNETHLKKW